MSYDFDLFVIGGGSGGVRAARLAAEKGLKVAMAEGNRMGGTCVIRGCVPKKLMLFASEIPSVLDIGRGFGWDVHEASFDWESFHSTLQSELDRLEDVYKGIMERNNVRLFQAWANLDDANHVTLDNGLRLSAERILIATGGRPFMPNFEGNEHAMVSDDVFNLDTLPKRLLVMGGGYIASEFAGIFHGLGSKVTQIYRGDLILRGYDHEMRQGISDGMIERGVDLRYHSNISKIELIDDQKQVTFENGDAENFDAVLVATGRIPNIEGLSLENAGVQVDKGAIKVDEFSQTSAENIYAVGDVTGRAALTPVAIREAVNFIKTVYDDNPQSVNYGLIPTAIFTHPEFGTIGMSEETARDAGFDVEIYATRFRTMFSAFADLHEYMFMKIVVDKSTDKVLGVHILGQGASEMIQLVGIAVTMGATKSQFDATIAVHPTASEELVTLKTPRTS